MSRCLVRWSWASATWRSSGKLGQGRAAETQARLFPAAPPKRCARSCMLACPAHMQHIYSMYIASSRNDWLSRIKRYRNYTLYGAIPDVEDQSGTFFPQCSHQSNMTGVLVRMQGCFCLFILKTFPEACMLTTPANLQLVTGVYIAGRWHVCS